MSVTNINCCRLCQSKNIYQILSFGETPLANSYPTTQDAKEDFYPLTLMQCKDCGHVQLKETVDPKILFENYLYSSSDSPSLVKHFEEYAKTVIKNVIGGLALSYQKSGQRYISPLQNILEIGCNDGILLSQFEKILEKNTALIGVEPATNLVQKARKQTLAVIYNNFFNESVAKGIWKEIGHCEIICANNVFAHVAELDSLMRGIRCLLAPNGVFVFENAYLLDTIRNSYFDQTYHEHLQYYGIKPLIKFFDKYGMEIFNVEHVETQGGSFRAYVKFKSNSSLGRGNDYFSISPSVQNFINEEEKFNLYSLETYKKFEESLNNLKKDLEELLLGLIQKGKTISCYGCPAKFTLFSKFFGLTKDIIKYVVDDSLLKQGRFAPGSKIPIVSNQHFKENPTDYCIISVWNMAEPIMKKNSNYKGKFILPMPSVVIK